MKQMSVNKFLRGFTKVVRDAQDVEIVRGEFGAPVKGATDFVGYFLTLETYLKLIKLPGSEIPIVEVRTPFVQEAEVNGVAVTPPEERKIKEPLPCSGEDCTVKTLFVARGADGKKHPLCVDCQKKVKIG